MTLSPKPEVHNIFIYVNTYLIYCNASKIDSHGQNAQKQVKFRCVVFEISVDEQTNTQTHRNTRLILAEYQTTEITVAHLSWYRVAGINI